ncbi:hypothetical protein LEM8419_02692 [Neolewinella maritima]|uniref:Uncharacterized protein n=1 Tax=Neolewinella maritima TaxID=1383882 RepID=A0ABM9B387_9BACT|nr:hypothetical protein [Neolewinella maritima]CAH1001785.1 hypothetical protein LEM8419_02692 [Neolewinella maritima]
MDYRENSLRNLAAARGYQFTTGDEMGLHAKLRDFRLTAQGGSRTITNVLRKQHGLLEHDVALFDYSYYDYGTRHTSRQTVLFLESQQLGLPVLRLQPETILHKLGELLGMHDIDFVRFPKFSGQYRLTGDDEDYIRHHFTEDVLNYFTLNKGWSLEGIGYYLILYKRGVLLPPEQLDPLYRRGMDIYRLFSSSTV